MLTRSRPGALLAALLVLPLLLLGSPAALAHDTLISTTPKKDSSVSPPDSVEFTYSANILQQGAAVRVIGPDGQDATEGGLTIEGPKLTQPLAKNLAGGKYTVVWRVLSSDGHPISGRFAFSVKGAPGESADDSSSEPGSFRKVTSTATPTGLPPQQKPTDATDNEPVLILGGAAAALLLIAGGAVVARRRLTDDDAPEAEDADSDTHA